jgi:SAM-dependent methyltransferase
MATLTTQTGRFAGVSQIFLYNWHFYVGAAIVDLVATLLLVFATSLPGLIRFVIFLAAIGSTFWALSSLVVSHFVYDRSPLYGFAWLTSVLRNSPKTWANIHAGLDQTTEKLLQLFPTPNHHILDIYDRSQMSEPSIGRARRHMRSHMRSLGAAQNTSPFALPLRDAECDAIFLIFAAHELRHRAARLQFFREIVRSAKPGGRIVLVEHLRDFNNFVAYGPGAMHFFSRREWLKVCSQAGLFCLSELSVTPFIRCMVFTRFS